MRVAASYMRERVQKKKFVEQNGCNLWPRTVQHVIVCMRWLSAIERIAVILKIKIEREIEIGMSHIIILSMYNRKFMLFH